MNNIKKTILLRCKDNKSILVYAMQRNRLTTSEHQMQRLTAKLESPV